MGSPLVAKSPVKLPPLKSNRQSQMLMSRRWSTSSTGSSGMDVYSHYVSGVNENDAMLREHRKEMCAVSDGIEAERAKQRAAYDDVLSSDSANAVVRAWSREKYKALRRRRPQADEGEDNADDQASTPTTRKTATSRASTRSRDSVIRVRSRSTLSASDVGDEQPKKIRTFWWYCGVIKALCKLGLDMKRLSMRKTEKTPLSEMYYVSVGGTAPAEQEDGQILFFDKSLFTRKRAACRVPIWAQNLMIKKPEDRKPDEVHHLKLLLNSMRSFREKYTDKMRTKMCQVVHYMRCDKGRVVLRQGHHGHYFYFIYSGSVFIQIDLYDPKTDTTYPSTENIIRTGDSFGEIALLGDGLRSASVICREPTELCQIDKSTFMEICPALFQRALDKKIECARGFPLFADWEYEQVKQLCFLSQVLYIPHGKVLELDWSTAQYVYFVLKGQLSMIKEFNVTGEEEDTEAGESRGREKKKAVVRREDWLEEMKREEEETRYNVLGLTVSASSSFSKAARLGAKGTTDNNKRFACVGTLRTGDCTDLRILRVFPVKIPKITLLSEGVRVLRIAIRNFARYCPPKQAEEYLKKDYAPMPIPSNKTLVSRYFRDLSWKTYRKRVFGSLQRERAGAHVSHMPATSKGNTGWARWPGFDSKAEEKCAVLSERGGKTKFDSFPLMEPIRKPPHAVSQKPPDTSWSPVVRPSITVSTTTVASEKESLQVTNDRSLILPPPERLTPAFMRKSFSNSSLEF